MKRIIEVVCVALALGQPLAAVAAPSSSAAAIKAVVAANARSVAALNRRDLHGLEKTLAPDYVLYSLDRGVVHEAEYMAQVRGVAAELPPSAIFHSKVMSKKFEHGGVVIVVNDWITALKADRAGVRHKLVSGEVSRELWVERKGAWVEKEERDIKTWVTVDGKAIKPNQPPG